MIIIDLTIFSIQKIGGISVVWSEYLKRLKDRSVGLDIVIYYPENNNRVASELDLSEYDVHAMKPRGVISKYFPFFTVGNKKDILHTSYYQWYPFYRGTKIVTLHDFMHEKFAPIKSRFLHNLLKYLSLSSTDVILCISDATKNDLKEIYPNIYYKKDVRVIENAVSDDFYSESEHSVHSSDFLWVAGRAGYKNFEYALKMLSFLKKQGKYFNLSVVGPKLTVLEEECAIQYGVLDQLNIYSDISKVKLRALYSNALALLYLSKYEGFGLPILEAQKCLCPVVTLKNPASVEVGRDSVLYVNNNSEHEILGVIDLVSDINERARIVYNGIENANRYNWDNSIKKLVAIYKEYHKGD